MPSDLSRLKSVEWELLGSPLIIEGVSKCRSIWPQPDQITASRTENYDLHFIAEGNVVGPMVTVSHRSGEILSGEELRGNQINRAEVKVTLENAFTHGYEIHGTGRFEAPGTCSVVCREDPANVPPARVVEYCISRPALGHCPRHTDFYSENKPKVDRGIPESKTPDFWSYETLAKEFVGSADSYYICNKHFEVLCTEVQEEFAPEWVRPISLQFGPIARAFDSDFRRQIIEALSFGLGRRLISVGYTELDASNRPYRQISRAPYSQNLRKECGDVSYGPCHKEWEMGSFSESLLSTLSELYLTNRQKLSLDEAMISIWIARGLPPGMDLVAYSGALEVLARAWLSADEGRGVYVPKKEFESNLTRVFTELERVKKALIETGQLSDQWNAVMERMRHSNSIGSHERVRKFLEGVRLPIGDVETSLLRARHQYAHGAGLSGEPLEFLMVAKRGFETFLNRVILKMIGYNETYVDYSTFGFPVRQIDAPLGGPNGDEKLESPK